MPMQAVDDSSGAAVKFEPFTPPSTAELDAWIPGYMFLEFIECGGMGAVYKAVQKSLNRVVAVKLLPQVHRHKSTFSERFTREAHALAKLNHPHIVAVHDFGETKNGQMYYVMEFVPGMDLRRLLKLAPPEPKQILKIVTQVCEAIQFAHEHGIVHRDIKPANILIDERGNVKVADFGLVKIIGPHADGRTASGTTLGTPDYIAPEALDHSSNIDHRADIYSLGVMIYELITGHVPKGAWEPPSICSGSDKRIDIVVSRAMQCDPDKRYQHVSDITQVLEKLLTNNEIWKNYHRPPKNGMAEAGLKPGQKPKGAATVRFNPAKKSAKQTLAWVVVAMLLLGAGLSAAWQAGWLVPTSVKLEAPMPPALASVAPEQLQLAHWVIEHGGFVNIQTAASTEKLMGGDSDVRNVGELPAGPFTVWRVCFSDAPLTEVPVFEELVSLINKSGTVVNLNLRGSTLPPTALQSLASLQTLNSIDLTGTPSVTLESVPFIAACKQLKLLLIGGPATPIDTAVAQQLRLLLPECNIRGDE